MPNEETPTENKIFKKIECQNDLNDRTVLKLLRQLLSKYGTWYAIILLCDLIHYKFIK